MVHLIRLTPQGRGAVATLLIAGRGAAVVVGARFRAKSGKSLEAVGPNRLVFGRIEFGSGSGEEVVVRKRSDDWVEVHCHGGHAAAAAIERVLVERGCTPVDWRDWIGRHEQDPIAAAARLALADVRTERTAAILLDQYNGALRRALDDIEHALRRRDALSASRQIDVLLSRVSVGRHLIQPWRVVLAGPPNVGKSSLINALVGYRRAIVHHAPGTTRDAVTARAAVEGWPIELSDTAGLRRSDHPVERSGIELAHERLSAADLVLLIFDWSQPWSETDCELVENRTDALVIHNKCDLAASSGLSRPEGLLTSALSGEGVQALVAAIAQRLVPAPPPPGAAVPFTEAQIETLQSAADALREGDADRAVSILETGLIPIPLN
jgi:tRNA modification GTPase